MLGYDMGWASFHVVEVMSSPKFHLKSVGYLAASQSFSKDTDVLMLTTNLLKKVRRSTPTQVFLLLNSAGLKRHAPRHLGDPERTLAIHNLGFGSRSASRDHWDA